MVKTTILNKNLIGRNMNKFKIKIITTKGCEACNILVQNTKDAIATTSKKVELEIVDKDNVDQKWLKANRINDYPTILLLNHDIILMKDCGCNPTIVVHRWMDIHFKNK